MLEIISHIIIFGGILSLFLAITQLVAKDRTIQHYLIALLLIFLGIFQFKVHSIYYGIAREYPATLLFSLPVFLSIGPFLYFNFLMLMDSRFTISFKNSLHLLPALVFFLLEITSLLFISFPDSMIRRRLVVMELFTAEQSATTQIVQYTIYGAVFYTIPYQLSILKNTLNLYRFSEMDLFKKLLFLVITISLFSTTSFFLLIFTGEKFFLLLGTLILTFLIMFAYIILQREVDPLKILSSDLRRKRYERSLLNGIDVEKVQKRLNELMEEEKLYADSDITLPKLAEVLLITRHQLSEFLNEKLDMNFSTFINKYRIEEAKELLHSDADLSILQIAYSVGFNSKSAFNTAFQKFMGTTPAHFRKERYSGLSTDL
jgi:AraC-like DNA-binding protein